MSEEPTVTMDELAAILGDESANDLWALIVKNRQPKITLSPKQIEGALAALEGRSKAKADLESLGKAALQYARADNTNGAGIASFLRGVDVIAIQPAPEAADHPALRYGGRRAEPRQEEAPAEEITSKRSPRRGPRPV